MKKLSLLLLILFGTLLANPKGEIVLFEEGWETHPEDPSATPDNENWKTIIHPNGRPFNIWSMPHSGTRCVIHTTAGITSGKPRDWMICKKPLVIPAMGGKLSYFVQATKPQNYEVRVSTTSYADTNNFSNFLFNAATTSGSWEEKVFDLTPFAGQTIYIAWKRKGPYGMANGTGWFIDDIKMVGYTQDQEGPECKMVYGNYAYNGKPMYLAAKIADQTAVDSVYAVSTINGITSALIIMQRNSMDSTIYNVELPYTENVSSGSVRFLTKDKLNNHGTSIDYTIGWGNILLSENFENEFPPQGWQNNGWKQSQQFGANDSKAAYSSFMYDGVMSTYPVNLTENSKLSFWIANRYLSVTGGGKVVGEDSIFCDISSDQGASWQNLMVYSPETPDVQHYKMEFDLSPVTGYEVLFRWRHSTNGSMNAEGALIDSVLVYSSNVGISGNELVINKAEITGSYPNPFNNTTSVSYQLNQAGEMKLAVYNAKGEMVKTIFNGQRNAGIYQSTFNADGLNSGLYFYRLTTATGISTRKVILVK